MKQRLGAYKCPICFWCAFHWWSHASISILTLTSARHYTFRSCGHGKTGLRWLSPRRPVRWHVRLDRPYRDLWVVDIFNDYLCLLWTYSIDAHWVNENAFRDHKYLLRLIVFHAGKLFSLLTASFGLLCFHNCKQELNALETYVCMYLLSLNAVILRITWHEPFLTKISFLSGSWPDVISVPFRKYCNRKSFGLASFISSILIAWISRNFNKNELKYWWVSCDS